MWRSPYSNMARIDEAEELIGTPIIEFTIM